MSPGRDPRYLLYFLIFVVAVLVLGGFAAFGPPGLFAKTETPEFCGSCHVLESEYETWFHGSHRRQKCVDCHLPNDTFVRHTFWKTVDGLKDFTAFHTGRVSETISLTDRGAAFVQENCLRCHAETVSRLNEDRRCWSCHRRLHHKVAGAIQTQAP